MLTMGCIILHMFSESRCCEWAVLSIGNLLHTDTAEEPQAIRHIDLGAGIASLGESHELLECFGVLSLGHSLGIKHPFSTLRGTSCFFLAAQNCSRSGGLSRVLAA